MRFKKDVSLDAHMVMAVRRNMLEPFAIARGMKPDEIFGRKDWLPKQSRQYLHQVEREISRLEIEKLSDGIGKQNMKYISGDGEEKDTATMDKKYLVNALITNVKTAAVSGEKAHPSVEQNVAALKEEIITRLSK